MIMTCSLNAVSQVKEEFDDLIYYIPNGLSISKTENSIAQRLVAISGERLY